MSLAEGVHDEGKGSPCIDNHPILVLHNLIVSFLHLIKYNRDLVEKVMRSAIYYGPHSDDLAKRCSYNLINI